MTERLVRPVRAWFEQDHWSAFVHTGQRKLYVIPNGESGVPFVAACASVVDAAKILKGYNSPLRSLRVLYENGCELKLEAPTAMTPEWLWFLNVDSENLPDDVESPEGMFSEDKDSEAVERAMIAASAWFTQADPATLGIDSPPPEPAS
jgi:hypothetical protein